MIFIAHWTRKAVSVLELNLRKKKVISLSICNSRECGEKKLQPYSWHSLNVCPPVTHTVEWTELSTPPGLLSPSLTRVHTVAGTLLRKTPMNPRSFSVFHIQPSHALVCLIHHCYTQPQRGFSLWVAIPKRVKSN